MLIFELLKFVSSLVLLTLCFVFFSVFSDYVICLPVFFFSIFSLDTHSSLSIALRYSSHTHTRSRTSQKKANLNKKEAQQRKTAKIVTYADPINGNLYWIIANCSQSISSDVLLFYISVDSVYVCVCMFSCES